MGDLLSAAEFKRMEFSFTGGKWRSGWGNSVVPVPPVGGLMLLYYGNNTVMRGAIEEDVSRSWRSITSLVCTASDSHRRSVKIFPVPTARNDASTGVAVQSPSRHICVQGMQNVLALLPAQLQRVDPLVFVRSPWQTLTIRVERDKDYCSRSDGGFRGVQEVCLQTIVMEVEMGLVNREGAIQLETTKVEHKGVKWASANSSVALNIAEVHRDVIDSRGLGVIVRTEVANTNKDTAIEVLLYEPIPDFLRVMLRKAEIHVYPSESSFGVGVGGVGMLGVAPALCSQNIEPLAPQKVWMEAEVCRTVSAFSSIPSLVFRLIVPASARATIYLPYEKRFVSRELQPTDASRGMDTPSAAVLYRKITASAPHGKWQTLFTDPETVTVPFPDASMPFNVITLASTVSALLFGSMINVLIRKSSLSNIDPVTVEFARKQQ